jgi:putative membrane protein
MLKLPVDRDVILDMVKQRPTDAAAFGRTILANERTFLAFFRTGLALLAGGIGIIGFVERPIIVALGWLAIALSVPFFIWGIWRYRVTKALIIGAALTVFHKENALDNNQQKVV